MKSSFILNLSSALHTHTVTPLGCRTSFSPFPSLIISHSFHFSGTLSEIAFQTPPLCFLDISLVVIAPPTLSSQLVADFQKATYDPRSLVTFYYKGSLKLQVSYQSAAQRLLFWSCFFQAFQQWWQSGSCFYLGHALVFVARE